NVFISISPPSPTSPLPLHDPLPISAHQRQPFRQRLLECLPECRCHDGLPSVMERPVWKSGVAPTSSVSRQTSVTRSASPDARHRSEEHTSELQSRENIVCRLLLA